MKTVYMPGVWDMLHVGHVRALKFAKQEYECLIVGVPTDSVVKKDKGVLPVISHNDRLEMISSLWVVDVADFYRTLDFLPHLRKYRPDALAVGPHWGKGRRHIQAELWCKDNEVKIVRVPYSSHISSTQIKKTVMKREFI